MPGGRSKKTPLGTVWVSRRRLKRPYNYLLSTGNCNCQASEEERPLNLPLCAGPPAELPAFEVQVIPSGLHETYKIVGLSLLLFIPAECHMRILIAEDNPVLADGLIRSLRASDYAVDCATDGGEADHVLAAQNYDLVILDIGLPKLDGYEVLRRLRRRGSKTPVLILTARDGLDDRVRGLDLGGDDYLTKPFDLLELEARVRALIRRGQSGGGALLVHGALTLDTAGRRATLNAEPLDLSARELGVLEVLMLRSGRVVNKDQLAGQLYGWDEEVGTNAIEVYVHRLRRKLEPAGVAIRTIRGLGYLLEKTPHATG